MTTVQSAGLLSAFFPMWNEQEYIHKAIAAAHEAFSELVAAGDIDDYELVIVNDASTDATARLADEIAAADRRVRVVHHPTNRKLGGSIKSGLAAARGDVVLYTDADLPFELGEVARALRVMRAYDADLICAYRHDRTGEGPRRMLYSWVYNWLIALTFRVHVRDVNFAFKLVRRRVLDAVTLVSEGSFVDAELVVRASRMGFQLAQIGVDYFPRTRGESTLSSPGVIVTMLREMQALRADLLALTPTVDRPSATGPAHPTRPDTDLTRTDLTRTDLTQTDLSRSEHP